MASKTGRKTTTKKAETKVVKPMDTLRQVASELPRFKNNPQRLEMAVKQFEDYFAALYKITAKPFRDNNLSLSRVAGVSRIMTWIDEGTKAHEAAGILFMEQDVDPDGGVPLLSDDGGDTIMPHNNWTAATRGTHESIDSEYPFDRHGNLIPA